MSIAEDRRSATRRYGQLLRSSAQREVTREAGMGNAPVLICSEDETIDEVWTRAEVLGASDVGLAIWRKQIDDIQLLRIHMQPDAPAGPDAYEIGHDITLGMILDTQPGSKAVSNLLGDEHRWMNLATA